MGTLNGALSAMTKNDTYTDGTDRWTVNQLIQYAKTLDRGREYQDPQERIRNRKLAFGARKWARTKQSLQADTDQGEQ